jgi:hypothetical protein
MCYIPKFFYTSLSGLILSLTLLTESIHWITKNNHICLGNNSVINAGVNRLKQRKVWNPEFGSRFEH